MIPGPSTSRRLSAIVAALCCLFATVGCSDSAVTFEYRDDASFTRADRRAIEAVTTQAVHDVRALLPGLPPTLRLTVQTGTNVIPETGETAETGQPAAVYWTVEPSHRGGVLAVVNAQLRATLFHELYHLVREASITPVSLVDHAIDEGLATAFERDFGGAPTPWGAYPDNVADWTKEFLALPPNAPQDQWMFRHPDGRRWIGFKVGTYLVDRAVRQSGRSVAQLATVPTPTIVAWAHVPVDTSRGR